MTAQGVTAGRCDYREADVTAGRRDCGEARQSAK